MGWPQQTENVNALAPFNNRNALYPYLPGTRAFTQRVDDWQPPNPLNTLPSQNALLMNAIGAVSPIKRVGRSGSALSGKVGAEPGGSVVPTSATPAFVYPEELKFGDTTWRVVEAPTMTEFWKTTKKMGLGYDALAVTDHVNKTITIPAAKELTAFARATKNKKITPEYIFSHEKAHIEVANMGDDAYSLGESVLDAARRGDTDLVRPETIKYYRHVQELIDNGYAMNEATLIEEILAEELAHQNLSALKYKK